MKKYLLILLLLSISALFSQNTTNKGTLYGNILDFKTKIPIPYVNIICFDIDKKIITGGITDAKGYFFIKKIPLGKVNIEIQFIGYKTVTKKLLFTKENNKIDLKTILLIEDVTNLEEVIVQTEKSVVTQKIDRKVYNIAKDFSTAGTTSLEMLQNIPSVNVDFQTGGISLRGNENVRVLIDGKPSVLNATQLLKQIPSSSIKEVEVITNPSAKYNPEGMSGIINIILKKGTKIGFNGTLTTGIKMVEDRTILSASTGMNYKTGNVNFFINYNVDDGSFKTISELDRTDVDFNQRFNFLDQSTNQYLKAGVDFYLNSKNTLSFFVSKSHTTTNFEAFTQTYSNQQLISNTPNVSLYTYNENTYNLDYVLDFEKKGHQIEFEINYSDTSYPEEDSIRDEVNPNSPVYNYTNSIVNDTDMMLINIDYTNPLAKGIKLELGAELRVENIINKINTNQEIPTNGIPATVPQGNTTFTYDREILSAYVNYNHQYKKLALQTGVRFEQFFVNGVFTNTQQAQPENYKETIYNLYPSVFLTYSASDKNEFQASYSRRVDRPSIYQVSPIQEWTSTLTRNIGNRNLRPQYTNSFEVNYTRTIKNGYITMGAFYRETIDNIGRIIYEDAIQPNVQILSYTNYDTAKSSGLEISGRFKPQKWWTLRPSSSFYTQNAIGAIGGQIKEVTNQVFRFRVSNSFKLAKKVRFYLSGVYKGRSRGVLFTVNPYFTINSSLKLNLFNGKGSLVLRGADLLNTLQLDFTATDPFPQKGFYQWDSRTLYLGFTYNFGSGKNKNRSRKYREKNETQSSGGIL